MKLLVNTKVRSLGALRLAVTFILAAAFAASAFAQAAPLLTLNSNFSLFDFGRVKTGIVSPATIITISNSGTAALTISSVTITGTNATDYQFGGSTCIGATLAPGGTCTATVRFAPLSVGTRVARLTLANNASGSQHLIPLTGVGLNPNIPNKAVGPIDPRVAFPLWYQDDLGSRVSLCLDTNTLCLTTPPNTSAPASVTDASINFPDEAFYWYADARITGGGKNGRLVIAKEAAFTTADAVVGQQITFDRVRVRISNLVAGASYTITHPFGTITLVADADGVIDNTEDIGCGAAPCDFRAALNGKVSNFLRWDPAVAPAAPAGYLGDPNVTHTITGSPFNTNFFRVVGPNAGGVGINTVQTNQFTIAGKIFQ
jgi:hypothetical protein